MDDAMMMMEVVLAVSSLFRGGHCPSIGHRAPRGGGVTWINWKAVLVRPYYVVMTQRAAHATPRHRTARARAYPDLCFRSDKNRDFTIYLKPSSDVSRKCVRQVLVLKESLDFQ
jgi:hypothetical protein